MYPFIILNFISALEPGKPAFEFGVTSTDIRGLVTGTVPKSTEDLPETWEFVDLGRSGFANSKDTCTIRLDENGMFSIMREGETDTILMGMNIQPLYGFIALNGPVSTVRWLTLVDEEIQDDSISSEVQDFRRQSIRPFRPPRADLQLGQFSGESHILNSTFMAKDNQQVCNIIA